MRDDELLLSVRRSAHGRGTWAPPGGKPLAGESVEECALRELREEAGLSGHSPEVVATSLDGFPDSRRVFRTTFVRVVCDKRPPARCEPGKHGEWSWHSASALPTPLFAPMVSLVASASLG